MRILLFALPFCLAPIARAELTVDSQSLTEAAQKACLGENPGKAGAARLLIAGLGGNAFTFGHLLVKEYLIADGPQWPENYVEESALNKLGSAALHFIQNGASCRQAMNASLNFQSVGLAARPALKKAFGPLAKEVLAGGWVPASEEAIALHDRCAPAAFQFNEQTERAALGAAVSSEVQSILGRKPVYVPDVPGELYWRYLHAALKAKAPQSCEDIDAIRGDLFRRLAQADNELLAKVEKVKARFGALDNPSPEAAPEAPAPDSKPAP